MNGDQQFVEHMDNFNVLNSTLSVIPFLHSENYEKGLKEVHFLEKQWSLYLTALDKVRQPLMKEQMACLSVQSGGTDRADDPTERHE